MPTDIKKILISVSINKVSTFFICSDFLVVGTRGSLGGICTVYKGVPVSKTTAWDCRNGKALLWFKHKCLQVGTAVHRNWQLHFLLPDVNSLDRASTGAPLCCTYKHTKVCCSCHWCPSTSGHTSVWPLLFVCVSGTSWCMSFLSSPLYPRWVSKSSHVSRVSDGHEKMNTM